MTCRVLIVADHASAKFGGEAALPLHYFRVLKQRGLPVWLLVHERTRSELEVRFPDDLSSIYFIPDTFIHRFLYRVGKPFPHRIAYFTSGLVMRLFTQLEQRRICKRLIKECHIDVIHQPMPVSPKEPSMLFSLGAPVVIGPMNGGMRFPEAFGNMQSRFVSWTVALGRLCSSIINRILPGKRHAVLVVANKRTQSALPRGSSQHVFELVENGVDLTLWHPAEQPADGIELFKTSSITKQVNIEMNNTSSKRKRVNIETDNTSSTRKRVNIETDNTSSTRKRVKGEIHSLARRACINPQSVELLPPKQQIDSQAIEFVYMGRLVDWKAVDLLLDAFQFAANHSSISLRIIGDGDCRSQLEKQAEGLGLLSDHPGVSGKVFFNGWLSQEDCARQLETADALVLPSLYECGGAVVLEAMAVGIPVIATAWGGPLDYLDETCGILVPPLSKRELIEGLAEAMQKLAESRDLRTTMGAAGRSKVEQLYDWETKVDRMLEIYRYAIREWSTHRVRTVAPFRSKLNVSGG